MDDKFFKLFREGTHVLQQGKVNQAIKLLEQARQLDQEHIEVTLNLSGAYILTKKFDKAISLLEWLSKQEPHNPMIWTNLGAAYLGNPVLANEEKQQKAIIAFERAIELNPITPNVAYNLGLIYIDRKENERALYWFKRAIQANPKDKDARAYIAELKQ